MNFGFLVLCGAVFIFLPLQVHANCTQQEIALYQQEMQKGPQLYMDLMNGTKSLDQITREGKESEIFLLRNLSPACIQFIQLNAQKPNCSLLMDRFNQCEKAWQKGIASGGKPIYSCVRPKC